MTTEKLIEELRDYAEIFETEGKGDEELERLAKIIGDGALHLSAYYDCYIAVCCAEGFAANFEKLQKFENAVAAEDDEK